jgi:hypothetical protein
MKTKLNFKNTRNCHHQWVMPVILATQEADQEDRGLKPAKAIVCEILSQKNPSQTQYQKKKTKT